MSTPQQTPWRRIGARLYDASDNAVKPDRTNNEFILTCVNQHDELLAEIERLRDKVAKLERFFK